MLITNRISNNLRYYYNNGKLFILYYKEIKLNVPLAGNLMWRADSWHLYFRINLRTRFFIINVKWDNSSHESSQRLVTTALEIIGIDKKKLIVVVMNRSDYDIVVGLMEVRMNLWSRGSNCSARIAGDCPSPRHATLRSNTVSKQSGVYPRLARTDCVASRLWGALAVPIIFVTGIAPKPIPASSPPRREVRSRGGGGGGGRSHRAPVRVRGRLSHRFAPTKLSVG